MKRFEMMVKRILHRTDVYSFFPLIECVVSLTEHSRVTEKRPRKMFRRHLFSVADIWSDPYGTRLFISFLGRTHVEKWNEDGQRRGQAVNLGWNYERRG